MKKEQFIQHMMGLKEMIDIGQEINNAMRKLSPDFGGFYNEKAETLVVKLIGQVMKDKADWIGYYIYELDWGKKYKTGCITENKKNIKLKTLSDLYDLIKK